tara:strand:+ start:4325 stop:4513 length:189 start_codon:yes stop_codon:yes gene_type:complete
VSNVKIITMYFPFSFDEPESISTEIKIYVDGELVEVYESNKILEGEELEKIENQKREHYEKS